MTFELNPDQPFIDELEREIELMSSWVVRVRAHECLACYVFRMVDEYDCMGSRFMLEYREQAAPLATALLRRMARQGAFCDCELFLNAIELRGDLMAAPTLVYVPLDGGYVPVLTADFPDTMPACAGVRRGSTQPCGNWVRCE